MDTSIYKIMEKIKEKTGSESSQISYLGTISLDEKSPNRKC